MSPSVRDQRTPGAENAGEGDTAHEGEEHRDGRDVKSEWETLEAFARQSMQQFLQRMLEAEVDELLARARYERRGAVDAPGGYRNGFGSCAG